MVPPETKGTQPLNDTGLTWGGDFPSGNSTGCSGQTITAQDCSSGRDKTHNDDGNGHAGFDYTKISRTGLDLPSTEAEWGCVRDNVTGLTWEIKTTGDGITGNNGLHDSDDTFNWYNTDTTSNGGRNGHEDDDGATCQGYTSGEPSTYCNTEAYVSRVNTEELCGKTQWRMPARSELRGLVNHDRSAPAIDTNFFPNTTQAHHWTSSPAPSSSIWIVSTSEGFTSYGTSTQSFGIRLVHD